MKKLLIVLFILGASSFIEIAQAHANVHCDADTFARMVAASESAGLLSLQRVGDLVLSSGFWLSGKNLIAVASLLVWIYLSLLRAGFWRVRPLLRAPDPTLWPPVVAVVPARNEADVVTQALDSLLTQNYPGVFHVILVDDHSSDGTAALAVAAASKLGQSTRLTVISARDLPAGWAGKVWAQSEGLIAARALFPDARFLFLTDADIHHAPSAMRQLVAQADAEQLVLASLMVRLRCKSVAERALIPAFVFFFAMLYPFRQVNDSRSRVAAAAGGCMLVDSGALERIGGIAAIKDALIDDCALAAKLKRQGAIRLDLAEHSYSIRPYADWSSIWNMIARSAFTQLRYSPWLLGGTVLGMLVTYLAPPVLALCGAGSGNSSAFIAFVAWLVMALTYCPMLRYYRQPLWWAPVLPAVALFYLAATLASAWRYWRGRGGQWKGRAQAIRKV